jgi:glycogen operon protein
MLLGGDELGRTQAGNNNAYCHDSELSWFDWAAVDGSLQAFTRRLIALRRAHPVFRRRRWYRDGPDVDDDDPGDLDIDWRHPRGSRMRSEEWHTEGPAAIAVYLSGRHLVDTDGLPMEDDSFYVCLNAGGADLEFRLPDDGLPRAWERVMDTAAADPFPSDVALPLTAGDALLVASRSVVLLRASA